MIRILKGELKRRYGITDLGVLSYTLGLEVEWTRNTILPSHKEYARTVVARFAEFLPGKSHVPMDSVKGPKLSVLMGRHTAAGQAIMAKHLYRHLLGPPLCLYLSGSLTFALAIVMLLPQS